MDHIITLSMGIFDTWRTNVLLVISYTTRYSLLLTLYLLVVTLQQLFATCWCSVLRFLILKNLMIISLHVKRFCFPFGERPHGLRTLQSCFRNIGSRTLMILSQTFWVAEEHGSNSASCFYHLIL